MPGTFQVRPSHITGEDVRQSQRDLTALFAAWDIDLNANIANLARAEYEARCRTFAVTPVAP